MELYVGMDVSLKETSICVVDSSGKIVSEGTVISEPSAALSLQINKSDRNDAAGLARIMQCGWYKEVQVKRLSCHEIRAVLNSRAQLVKIKRDLEN